MSVFTVITVLFLSWTSGSVPESQTVEVQPGENITLSCINKARYRTITDWFRVTNRTKASCISSKFGHDGKVSFCDGFGKEKYEMMVNPSKISLHIKDLDFSDSGLYLCGFYLNRHTVISETTYLNVQALLVFFLFYMSIHSVPLSPHYFIQSVETHLHDLNILYVTHECNYSYFQNVLSDNLTYAAINFQAKPKRKRRPASGGEIEPHVVYAATR
uniref:Ig-like domain-containing protein n=1 Tax=Sphaeramia orbicularis TaxID=375764 RepID=A0A673CI62_9TELE